MGKKLTKEEVRKRLSPIAPSEKRFYYEPQANYYFFIPPNPDDGNSLGTGKSRPKVGTSRNGYSIAYYPEYYEKFRGYADSVLADTIHLYKKNGVRFPLNLKRLDKGEILFDKKQRPVINPAEVEIKLCSTHKTLQGKKVAKLKESLDGDNISGAFLDLPSFANGKQDKGNLISDRLLYDDNIRNIKKQSIEYIEEATSEDAPLGYGVYIKVTIFEKKEVE